MATDVHDNGAKVRSRRAEVVGGHARAAQDGKTARSVLCARWCSAAGWRLRP